MVGQENHEQYVAIKKKIESGKTHDAMNDLASYLFSDQCSQKYFELASLATISYLKHSPSTTHANKHNLTEATKKQFFSRLMRQDNCDCKDHIFLKTVTAHQSTEEHWVIPAVAKELEPILDSLYTKGTLSKNDILCLIVIRNFITAIPQEEISKIHLATFPAFTPNDLSLAYNTIFGASSVYHRNVKDIGQYIFHDETSNRWLNELRLYHLLLIVWLYSNDKLYPYKISELLDIIERKTTSNHSTDDDFELSAAKSLFAHHANELAKYNKDKLNKLATQLDERDELSTLLVEIQKNQSGFEKLLKTITRNRLNQKLDSKLYKSAMACKNIVTSRIGIRIPGKKLKIAICISGQLRGYKQTFRSWKKSILTDIDYDIYVHSWTDIGRSGAEPTRKSLPFDGENFQQGYRECFLSIGFDEIQKSYPTLFNRLHQSGIVDQESLKAFYGATDVALESDKDPKFDEFSNSEKMHYKINACNELCKQHNRKYDLILRIRPDLPIQFIGFDWMDIYNYCHSEPVIFADSACGVHYMKLMIGDQFALGSPQSMNIYSDAWNIYPKLGKNKLFKCSETFKGHISLALTCWTHGISVKKLAIKKGALQDSENMSVNEIYKAIKIDAEGRSFLWDEKLLNLLKRDGAN